MFRPAPCRRHRQSPLPGYCRRVTPMRAQQIISPSAELPAVQTGLTTIGRRQIPIQQLRGPTNGESSGSPSTSSKEASLKPS